MPDHRKLRVWHRAHGLTLYVYRATRGVRGGDSRFLVNQVRRSAASIGANIAEGAGHETPPQYRRFLGIAMGSASEVMNHVVLLRDLGWLTARAATHIEDEADAIRAMLTRLRRRIETAQQTAQNPDGSHGS